MKSLIKLGTVFLPLVLLTACANTHVAERAALKSLIDKAQSTADSAVSAARDAQNTADSALLNSKNAEMTANAAKNTADAAQSSVEECCAKIDRMFEKAMSK